jgi:hypothetical protein
MRNFELNALMAIPIRQFDGAETWSYLDGK